MYLQIHIYIYIYKHITYIYICAVPQPPPHHRGEGKQYHTPTTPQGGGAQYYGWHMTMAGGEGAWNAGHIYINIHMIYIYIFIYGLWTVHFHMYKYLYIHIYIYMGLISWDSYPSRFSLSRLHVMVDRAPGACIRIYQFRCCMCMI